MSSSFFVFLPSNTPINETAHATPNYPNNRPNKFRVRLPKPLYFNGNWVCGLHSISFAYSWPSTIGTLDEQFISIHFKHKDKKRIIRVPIPRASHTKVDDLRDSLALAFKLQVEAIKSINSGIYLKKSPLLDSPPGKRQKRAVSVSSPPRLPPPAKTPKKDENKSATPVIPSLPSSTKSHLKSPPKIETVTKERIQRTSDQSQTTIPLPSITVEPFPVKPKQSSETPQTSTHIVLPNILIEQTPTHIVLPNILVEQNSQTVSVPKTPTKPAADEHEKQQQNLTNVKSSQPVTKTRADTQTTVVPEKKKDDSKTDSKSFANENKEVNDSKAEKYLSGLLGADRYDLDYLDLGLFQEILGGVELQYEKGFERFKAVFKDKRIEHISFTLQLGYVLGFVNPHHVDNDEIAKYGCDLRGGFSNFGVYAKGLTENMIIGNSLSSLLRVVSVTGATPGEYQEKIYDTPIYARVLPREISEIQIELRTLDDGRLVPFAYGTVLAVLIFKRVIDF